MHSWDIYVYKRMGRTGGKNPSLSHAEGIELSLIMLWTLGQTDLWKKLVQCHSKLSDFKYKFKKVIPSTEIG